MSIRQRLASPLFSLARLVAGAVTVQVDDAAPGWGMLTDLPHERQWGEIHELYADTLEAWRKHPMAKRAIDIQADYIVGDGIKLASSFKPLQAYIDAFWNHRKNLMDNRLVPMANELALSGDLFPVLFTNPYNGLSYIRFITKDRITRIETAKNDWESELVYEEMARGTEGYTEPIEWLGWAHPGAAESESVMLHYTVNRPLGALMGEGDLTTLIPWLLRYSRMLEDRVRLHNAVRAFLWFVTVPPEKVNAKQAEYASPPDAGSVVVKDTGEEWEVKTPNLAGSDASHDLEALRRLIYSGSGYPPHWYGERGSNLAEAKAMQNPAERHLRRRQRYLVFTLQDIVYQGYARARERLPSLPALPTVSYDKLFSPAVPDISRDDNKEQSEAAEALTKVWRALVLESVPKSKTLTELMLSQVFKVMGEPQEGAMVRKMVEEMFRAVEKEEKEQRRREANNLRETRGVPPSENGTRQSEAREAT